MLLFSTVLSAQNQMIRTNTIMFKDGSSISENHIIQITENKVCFDGDCIVYNSLFQEDSEYKTYSFSDNSFDTIWDIKFDKNDKFISAKKEVFSYKKQKYITITYKKTNDN